MNDLKVISELVNWSILAFIFLRAIGTECFSNLDWTFTGIALLFSYFISYVTNLLEEEK